MSEKKDQTANTQASAVDEQTGKLVDGPPDLGLAGPSAGPEPGIPSLDELADGLVEMNLESLMKAAADAGLDLERSEIDAFLAGRDQVGAIVGDGAVANRPGGFASWQDKGLDVFDLDDALAGPLGTPVTGTPVGGGFGTAGGYDPTLAAGGGKLKPFDEQKFQADRDAKAAEKAASIDARKNLPDYDKQQAAKKEAEKMAPETKKDDQGKDLIDKTEDTVEYLKGTTDPETYEAPDGGQRPVTTVDIENALAEQELQNQIHGPRTGGPQDDTGGGPLNPTGDGDQNNDGVPDNPHANPLGDPRVDAPPEETFSRAEVEAAVADAQLRDQIHGPDYDPNAEPIPATTGASQGSGGGPQPLEGQVSDVGVGGAPPPVEGPPPTIDAQSPGDFAPGLDDGEAPPVGVPEGGAPDLDGDGQPG